MQLLAFIKCSNEIEYTDCKNRDYSPSRHATAPIFSLYTLSQGTSSVTASATDRCSLNEDLRSK